MAMPNTGSAPNWGLLDKQSEISESRQEKINFGKMNLSVIYQQWAGSKENPLPPTEVTEAVYAALPDKQRGMKLIMTMDVREFGAPFDYVRNLNTGDKDWFKSFKPSVENLFGTGSMGKGKWGQTLANLQGKYVEVHDVPQSKESKDGKIYGYPTIIRVFTTREECLAAKNARFPVDPNAPAAATSVAGSVSADVPTGWTVDGWESVKPAIRTALAQPGASAAAVATQYGVDVRFVAALVGTA